MSPISRREKLTLPTSSSRTVSQSITRSSIFSLIHKTGRLNLSRQTGCLPAFLLTEVLQSLPPIFITTQGSILPSSSVSLVSSASTISRVNAPPACLGEQNSSIIIRAASFSSHPLTLSFTLTYTLILWSTSGYLQISVSLTSAQPNSEELGLRFIKVTSSDSPRSSIQMFSPCGFCGRMSAFWPPLESLNTLSPEQGQSWVYVILSTLIRRSPLFIIRLQTHVPSQKNPVTICPLQQLKNQARGKFCDRCEGKIDSLKSHKREQLRKIVSQNLLKHGWTPVDNPNPRTPFINPNPTLTSPF